MSRDPQDWQEQLQASLRRAQDAIARGSMQQEEMVRAWTESLRSAYPDWGRERWQRRLERKLRRRAEREAKIAHATLFEGYLWVVGAILLFIMALTWWPVSFWLIFPAVGLGSRGMRVVGRHAVVSGGPQGNAVERPPLPQPDSRVSPPSQSQQRAQRFGAIGGTQRTFDGNGLRQPVPAAPSRSAPQQDPRDARVDAICDKLLAELRTSPETVKDIFIKPEETVQALRATCRDLTRRERELRRFLSPEEDVRLTTERAALQKRIDGEGDEVTKMRLASALAALDQQREQRAELSRAAARFDAEHTRISYTLESLHTQVVRMRSADSSSVDVAGAGLRRSLDLLTHEVNALADALERVNSGADSSRMRKVAEAPGTGAEGGGPGTPGTREKA